MLYVWAPSIVYGTQQALGRGGVDVITKASSENSPIYVLVGEGCVRMEEVLKTTHMGSGVCILSPWGLFFLQETPSP